ncbi:glycoside hydrolase family 15 protein [Planctomicrobium sp. SH527]|uniref:glycoside hydrolase family 15 protein n=1 Tax=Planctomicrobium sp. SH527 TaxID=3448123 RepID=UPI003F5C3F9D
MPQPVLPPELELSDSPTAADVSRILSFLTDQGTFQFPTLSSGLFSAAAAENPDFRLTGYQYVWTRDNCHVAHALWATGDRESGVRAVKALLQFYGKSRQKFLDIIEGRMLPTDPMQRPHIRFDGESLTEIDVRWAHAQNDALGYTVWLSCKLMRAGNLTVTHERVDLLRTFVQYFQAIRFWDDEDNGHWEEARKIESSSIGPVVAGLVEFRALLAEQQIEFIDAVLLDDLIEQGRRTLLEILPAECIQPDLSKNRRYDAALLFLIYPLAVVDDEMAAQILADVDKHLTGPIGIRRYIGDSYWCANYRQLLSPEVRTTDFSDDMESRDRLLQPGQEAQWCLFDPIVSTIWGERYRVSRSQGDLQKQIHHLRRSLAHLTAEGPRTPAFRFPESYFLENEEWVPNDICPLLWTQANVLLALKSMSDSLS